ncbi:MAG: hypothetical protein HYV07_29605 [Deltaproteobacteria bacterium]|nr:hypothetical protein [Deltaproteobacteria bacterium]
MHRTDRGLDGAPPEGVAATLARGRPLRDDAGEALERLLGTFVGKEGLSRAVQPGFPGLRTYVVMERAATDRVVEFTVAGVSREGEPVYFGSRAIGLCRDGSLELHHGYDEVDPEFRSRNVFADSLERELALLTELGRGPRPRLTADGEGTGRYVCALHGLMFADETEQGPPIRTRVQPGPPDRFRLVDHFVRFAARQTQHQRLPDGAHAEVVQKARACRTPLDFAGVDVQGGGFDPAGENELGGASLGRAALLADDGPAWRGALYVGPPKTEAEASARTNGAAFRARLRAAHEQKNTKEIEDAIVALEGPRRQKIRALHTLARVATARVATSIRPIVEGPDRRLASVARRALQEISNARLPDLLRTYADDARHPIIRRALAYRVLAEYFPRKLDDVISMLRVHPDARLARAAVPCLDPPDLASLLAANGPEPQQGEKRGPREGLAELRIEVIERLALARDPRTLPVLAAALDDHPPPAERLALTRALLASPDPRGRTALSAASFDLGSPQVP